jgi:V/A-type H+-transporting ATPase subunit A
VAAPIVPPIPAGRDDATIRRQLLGEMLSGLSVPDRAVDRRAEMSVGSVASAVGPVVRATGMVGAIVGEVVHVGPRRLLGEIIGLDGPVATIQVYEETAGLEVGDAVEPTGAPLRARLGPGLLGSTFDGLQRPLDLLAAAGTWLLRPGLVDDGGERIGTRRWAFEPERRPGDSVGRVTLGMGSEGPIRHRILVPRRAPRPAAWARERSVQHD